jgi:glycosyltransferase involved in cell wall biosynthesis
MILTIFTPTYNRGDLLERLYQSLIEQKCNDFEWLIIDDGSTDNTALIVEEFIKERKINIRYIYKENGGKHTAHNLAVVNAYGDLFVCVDSDDQLAPNAIKAIMQSYNKLQDHDCGFIAYKQDNAGKLLSTRLQSNEIIHYGLFHYREKLNIVGEFTLIFKRDIIQKYLFPTFPNEHFIGECVLYDLLEIKGYTFCPLKEVIELCEYQNEGLSSDFCRLLKENPAGYCLYFMQRIDMQEGFIDRLITAGKYNCFCIFSKTNRSRYTGKNKIIVAITKPLGWAFWLYYKIVRKF